MKIDKNSRGTLALVFGCCTVVALIFIFLVRIPWLVYPMLAMLLWVCVWQLAFFRIPKRERRGSDRLVTSVADGKVVILEKVYEKEYLKQECIQLSVYMNFFDVHANFWPVDGRVDYYRYYPGKHFFAFKPKASEENEHSCVGIVTPQGRKVFFKQIAGGFARRIVCYGKSRGDARSGEQCGIIKFGSRIDIFLPLDAEIKVSLGDYVRACETVLAEI